MEENPVGGRKLSRFPGGRGRGIGRKEGKVRSIEPFLIRTDQHFRAKSFSIGETRLSILNFPKIDSPTLVISSSRWTAIDRSILLLLLKFSTRKCERERRKSSSFEEKIKPACRDLKIFEKEIENIVNLILLFLLSFISY